MGDCCDRDSYGARFSERFARRTARRYRRRGLTPSASDLVAFLAAHGLRGASVLEIGGGVGHLQIELLRAGAAHVTNLEISDSYEAEAAALLAEAGLAGRVTRRLVDIAESPGDVAPADLVLLHRVVCCYPDYERLLTAAGHHAGRALAFSHPPANVVTRLLVGAENLLRRVRRDPFRNFVHPPDDMVRVLERQGLSPTLSKRSRGWNVVGVARPEG